MACTELITHDVVYRTSLVAKELLAQGGAAGARLPKSSPRRGALLLSDCMAVMSSTTQGKVAGLFLLPVVTHVTLATREACWRRS